MNIDDWIFLHFTYLTLLTNLVINYIQNNEAVGLIP